jgi:hypothetical protein
VTEAKDPTRTTRVALGWIAGVVVGVVANYGLFAAFGDGYPLIPTTFVAVLAGAFGSMWIVDRLGPRSTPWIAGAAAVALVVMGVLFIGPWLTVR